MIIDFENIDRSAKTAVDNLLWIVTANDFEALIHDFEVDLPFEIQTSLLNSWNKDKDSNRFKMFHRDNWLCCVCGVSALWIIKWANPTVTESFHTDAFGIIDRKLTMFVRSRIDKTKTKFLDNIETKCEVCNHMQFKS